MKNSKNAIVLCSGGLDSIVTAYYVNKKLENNGKWKKYKKIIILFFDYGQRTLKEERLASRYCAKSLGAKFIEIGLDYNNFKNNLLTNKNLKINQISRKQLKNTKKESERFYVPLRNTVFLSYAIALAESLFIKNDDKKTAINSKNYDIFVGFKNEGRESYPDTTKEFVNSFNNLIEVSKLKGKIKIVAPLIKKDKEDIILLGERIGVNFKKTYSCYKGIGRKDYIHCGTCLACRLRQEAFYWANLKDPTSYKK